MRFARPSTGVITCVLAAALVTSACSGTGDAESRLAALYQGSSVSPATDAPKPQRGKKVWIISPDQSIDVLQEMTQGAADAARSIGWVPTIFDAKSQQDALQTGVEQAISAKADGIILGDTIDCSWVQAALSSAKYASIPVVGVEAQDCQPSLETVITYAPTIGAFEDVEQKGGVAVAQYLIAKGGETGTFIELKQTDSVATILSSKGYESTVQADCPQCTNIVVPFVQSDIGPALQARTQQALQQHPDATALFAPYDGVITSGVSAAVLSAGRAGSLTVIGSGGSTANLDLIRRGLGQTADLVLSTRWEGFATVDWLNRLFNGLTPDAVSAQTGIGYQLVDAAHNLPPSGAVPSPVDFEGIYRKSWGVHP